MQALERAVLRTQQLAPWALLDCQNVFLIFLQYNKIWNIQRENAFLGSWFSTRAWWHFSAVEHLVIKYQGVNDLAVSMSFDLEQLGPLHWASFSSQSPEVHSCRTQDKSAGKNKQGSGSLHDVCHTPSALPKHALPPHLPLPLLSQHFWPSRLYLKDQHSFDHVKPNTEKRYLCTCTDGYSLSLP